MKAVAQCWNANNAPAGAEPAARSRARRQLSVEILEVRMRDRNNKQEEHHVSGRVHIRTTLYPIRWQKHDNSNCTSVEHDQLPLHMSVLFALILNQIYPFWAHVFIIR